MTKEEFLSNAAVLGIDDCWNWLRGKEGHGYGMAWYKGKSVKANRVSWIVHNGNLPEWDGYGKGICVLHKCDNPACVNPNHLFLGTQKENIKDRQAKGRTARQLGEKHGMVKLKEKDIVLIRESKKSGAEMAKLFMVSQATISLIKTRKRWGHIA